MAYKYLDFCGSEMLCEMPSRIIAMENVNGFILVACKDGLDYVVTPEGQYRDVTGYRELFRSMQ